MPSRTPATGGQRWGLFAAFLLLAASLGAGPPQRVLHVLVDGDLDSTRLAREISGAIATAHAEHDLVLLELGANRWRRDVLWRLALAIQDAQTPVHTLLRDDRDGRVGLGAVILGALCEQVTITESTRLACESEDDLHELTPPEVDRERVDRELGGMLWVAMVRRGLPGEVSEALLSGRTALWLTATPDGLPTLAVEPPGPRAQKVLDATPERAVVGEVAPSDLLALGLVDGEAATARLHLRRVGLPRARLSARRVQSRLDDARWSVESLLAQADAHIHDVRARFDALRYPPDDRVVPAAAWREGGRAALAELEGARAALRRAEELFDQHAELLQTEAPEGTRVGRDDRQNARDWRRAFLDRLRDIEYLEQQARRYARR